MAPSEIFVARREGPVRVITMQREAKRIAVNRQLADALDAAPNEPHDDAALQAGVLTGGARVFCADSDPSDRFAATSSWQRGSPMGRKRAAAWFRFRPEAETSLIRAVEARRAILRCLR